MYYLSVIRYFHCTDLCHKYCTNHNMSCMRTSIHVYKDSDQNQASLTWISNYSSQYQLVPKSSYNKSVMQNTVELRSDRLRHTIFVTCKPTLISLEVVVYKPFLGRCYILEVLCSSQFQVRPIYYTVLSNSTYHISERKYIESCCHVPGYAVDTKSQSLCVYGAFYEN